jgi:flavin reductase (DIM6/NTAB) family NADH-FMN oxidoreductase RutF/DNA-binding GntR family transcriptional regulator
MTATGGPASALVDQGAFRDVIGRFASGVTVITTRSDGQDFGTTASAVSSLSMEPPMLLVCLSRTSETHEAIARAGCFGVNILGDGQAELAYAFAKKAPDKFGDMELVRGGDGVPLIPGAVAHLVCRVRETATGGTHTVFMGEVHHAAATDAEPLTYYRGRFGRFEDTRQDAAYRRIRELVISREIRTGEPLEVERLAHDLGFDVDSTFYAVTKLTTERLIERRADGQMAIRPIDVRTAHEAIEARCAIEVAVVDKVAGSLPDADVEILRGHVRAAEVAASSDPVDVPGLVAAGQAFHAHFIGLLRNEALQSFFSRLDIQAIWARTAPDIDLLGKISVRYLRELLDACIADDADGAKEILYDHAAEVKHNAREAIELRGGEL